MPIRLNSPGGGSITLVAATTSGNYTATLPGSTGAIGFDAGTKLSFAQATAPTGWTQVTDDTANNRMMRFVNTTGAGTGGSHSPILNNVVPAHTHGFTTGTVSSDHVHSIGVSGADDNNHTGNGNMVADSDAGYTGTRSTNGISANHTHSGSTDNGSSSTNWTPRYIDMILCSKT